MFGFSPIWLKETFSNFREFQRQEANSKKSHGDGRMAARAPKKGSGSFLGYAGSALNFSDLK